MMLDHIFGSDIRCQGEFGKWPVFGSIHSPAEQLHGSSGKSSVNLLTLELNLATNLPDNDEIYGLRKFLRLDVIIGQRRSCI